VRRETDETFNSHAYFRKKKRHYMNDLPAISISDLQGYVSRRVKELTEGNQRPVMAMPQTVDDYWIARRLN